MQSSLQPHRSSALSSIIDTEEALYITFDKGVQQAMTSMIAAENLPEDTRDEARTALLKSKKYREMFESPSDGKQSESNMDWEGVPRPLQATVETDCETDDELEIT